MATYRIPTPPFLGSYNYTVSEYFSLHHAWCLDQETLDVSCEHLPLHVVFATLVSLVAVLASLLRPQMLPAGVQKSSSWHFAAHNNFNMFMLPAMTALAFGGSFGLVPPWVVCYALAGYMAFDFIWISRCPKAVASKAKLILVHHAITCLLAFASAETRVEYAYICSWATCVEINTFLLVAMRQPRVRNTVLGKLLEVAFWITTVVFRFMLHPWIVYHTMKLAPRSHPGVRAMVSLGMAFMVLFNLYYVYLRVRRADKGMNAEAGKAEAQ